MKYLIRMTMIAWIWWILVLPASSQNVSRVEYFIDSDPGYGFSSTVPLSSSPNISNLSFSVEIGSIAPGFHDLYVRAKDDMSNWSLTAVSKFYKEEFRSGPLPQISRAEFYIDSDPGYGMATNIAFEADSNISNLLFPIDISTLLPGFHTLYIRSMDARLKWSLTAVRTFFKEEFRNELLPEIEYVEYFIDTDPGYGMATNVSIVPGTNISDIAFQPDIESLSSGFHTLYIRTKDSRFKWCLTAVRSFYKEAIDPLILPEITKVEYYFDTDPGYGLGFDIPVSPSSNIGDLSFLIDLNMLPPGKHLVFVRSKDNNGKWSLHAVSEIGKFQINAYLEGLYEGNGMMRQAIDEIEAHFHPDTADLVNIELHNHENYVNIIDTIINAALKTNGQLAFPFIPGDLNGSYYITIKHRNSIETTSAQPVSFAGNDFIYDFTSAASQAFGDNLKDIDGVYTIWGGDVNQDGIVDAGDINPVDNASTSITFGYVVEDVNGDGIVDGGDMNIVDNNSTAIIMVIAP